MKQVPPHFLLAPAVLAGVLAWHIPARANDGTIVITGNIVDNTCEVVDPPQPNHIKVVHLPKISTSALKKTGDTAGATPFSIKLQNCPESLGNGVKLYFEPGPTTDYSTRDLTAYKLAYTANSTTNSNIVAGQVAEGVQIRIANLDGTQIPMGENAAGQNARGFDPVAQASGGKKSVTLSYLASYVRKSSGDVDSGSITTYVGFSVVYP
ncbi:fimbrial subunit protein [Bordetella bronchiseptica RB50]|uniref:Fimbrial subunit protein n=1 Tax=Bordetella bronchiseptica (strain ATCC BAA-588 / NCTC 13252 / RB50) TaxID=257310 RepID=A0A0H3LPK1_BORBR|nr:fimbrial protein [Bordetella bronchiseptica]AMG90902.2 fimbrial protein [Bordetella bronchiseptica]CAE33917.1 fimbrial subunit protein [Bordetella bronchiseptica RB50]